MRKGMRGSFTVEAAVIVPLILMVFAVLMHLLFYYHDKNILASVAYETAVYGAGRQEVDESTLENHFYSRINDKLLLFTLVQGKAIIEEEQVKITCRAWKSLTSLKAEAVISRTEPEDYIRSIRKLSKIQERIGESE